MTNNKSHRFQGAIVSRFMIIGILACMLIVAAGLFAGLVIRQSGFFAPTTTASPPPTLRPTNTSVPTPTQTPIPLPQELSAAIDFPNWVADYAAAYGGKVQVGKSEMDADQLTEEILNNQEKYIRYRIINKDEYAFVLINGAPIALRRGVGDWQETTLKILGDLSGIEIGSLIDLNSEAPEWWGDEYQIGVATINSDAFREAPQQPNIGYAAQQIQIAHRNGMKVRLLPILQPSDIPDWMVKGFQQSDLDYIVRTAMDFVLQEGVDEVVVVNESGAPPSNRNDLYYRKFGNNYILRAFSLAREMDPSAKLIYNDGRNHLLNSNTTKATLAISQLLHASGLIDYVGVQMHIDQNSMPSKQELISIFRSYPVPVIITEFDALLTDLPKGKQEAALNDITKTVFDGCLESFACQGITTWGANDSVSWQNRSLLRDEKNQRKQAYYVALQSMYEHLP